MSQKYEDRPEDQRSAADFLPVGKTLDSLRSAAGGCAGCDLYKRATQTVFGDGVAEALVMFVGEQPGDREDLVGAPFVGPAGRVLDRALAQVGVPRSRVYVTNAVKHFKWTPKGRRRIHATPRMSEIRACRPWLEAEIGVVEPDLIVAMGSTAVKSLLGPNVGLMSSRGQVLVDAAGRRVLVTVHPSSVLRAPDDESREIAYRLFVEDLKHAAGHLAQSARR